MATSGESGQAGSVSVLTSLSQVRMVLAGQVDTSMNSDLVEAVSEVARRGLPVDVDTRAVTFMDSTVIALIAHLANRFSARVRFIEPPEAVRFLLDVTQIGELVDVVDHDPGFPAPPEDPPPHAA